MDDYIKSLEEQNEELRQKLAISEGNLYKYLPKVRRKNSVSPSENSSGLVQKIGTLPGISVSGIRPDKQYRLFFHVIPSHDNVGLFIIARSMDTRYWKHGDDWELKITVADVWENNMLPLTYCLECKKSYSTACKQAKDLVANIDLHLNHRNFLEGYGITKERLQEEV